MRATIAWAPTLICEQGYARATIRVMYYYLGPDPPNLRAVLRASYDAREP